MKRLALPLVALCLAAVATGCADDEGYDCDVTWYEGDPASTPVVGMAVISYDDYSDAQDAVDQCSVDQETNSERPANANGHRCECASQ